MLWASRRVGYLVSVKIRAEAQSDVGRRRDHNEDRYLVDDDLGLYVVCDGMGGHAAGEVASALAAETIQETVRSELGKAESHEEPLDPFKAAHVVEVLRRAVEAANTAVHRLGYGIHKREGRAPPAPCCPFAGSAVCWRTWGIRGCT